MMAKKIREYTITPARGQALLSFQGRRFPDAVTVFEATLREEVRAKKTSKPLIEDKERDLNADFSNLLLQGDCLSACAYLKSQNIKVDLVYIDPPFASGANYAKQVHLRNGGKSALATDSSIGEEVMYGDIWQKEDYLNWLYERLLMIRQVMSDTASIYVHLDWHIGHYVKVLMDEIFGEENFVNEIVWSYRSGGASKTTSIARKHDAIYFYSNRAEKFKINSIKERQYLEKPFMGSKIDEQGKYYVDTLLTDTLFGVINRVLPDDSIKEYSTRPVLNMSKERCDYNTQKPSGLLELLLEIASDEGMIVADFFSGSGTTAKVAHDLNRKFIACDIGINAVQTTRDRLAQAGAAFDVLKIQDGLRLFRNPQQTAAKMFSLIDGFKPAAEIDLNSFWNGGIAHPSGSYTPVKFSGIHDVLSRELLDIYLEEIYQLENSGGNAVGIKIIYAHAESKVTQSYVEQALHKAAKTELAVTLVSLDELLAEKRDAFFMPDNAIIEIKKHDRQYRVEIKKFHSPYLFKKLQSYNDKKTKSGTLQQNLSLAVEISEAGLEMIEAVQFDTTCKKIWRSNPALEDRAGIKDKIKAIYLLDTAKFKMKIRNIAGDEIIIDSEEIKPLS